jgi:hypothetical protein
MTNFFKKLGIGLSMAPVFSIPLLAHAAIGSGLANASTSVGTSANAAVLSTATSLPQMIGKGVGVLLGVLGIAFVVMVVYAGFLYLTANGEETNVKKAKKMLSQAVIGLVLIVSAYAITNVVVDALLTVSAT